MAKGIIVVDMPEKCCNCEMGFVNEYYDQFECYFKPGHEIKPDEGRPDWCPIKLISDKKDIKNAENMTSLGWIEGFNACLDEIEGKM